MKKILTKVIVKIREDIIDEISNILLKNVCVLCNCRDRIKLVKLIDTITAGIIKKSFPPAVWLSPQGKE